MKASLCAGAVLGAGLILSMPAQAQDSNPAAGGGTPDAQTGTQPPAKPTDTSTTEAYSRSRLEDIVVLGRKRTRAEELQQTPVAITALGPVQLQRVQ